MPQTPLQWHTGATWFRHHPTAMQIPLCSTYRFSDVVVQFFQALQPDVFGAMQCSDSVSHRTLVIPMLFSDVPELFLKLDGTMIAGAWGTILGISLPSGGGHRLDLGRWASARHGEVSANSVWRGGRQFGMGRRAPGRPGKLGTVVRAR